MTKNESSPTSRGNFQFLSYDLKRLEQGFNHGLTLQKCFEYFDVQKIVVNRH